MTGGILPNGEADQLRAAAFTYGEVGATRGETMPRGFDALRRTRDIGRGADRFEHATRTLLAWDMHRRAGVGVRASGGDVTPGAVAVLRLGVGPLGVSAPVRVIYVVDEPDRQGFAYGTLPSHPERGEEAFMVERHPDGAVTFTVTAFSRPATLLARAGSPFARIVQSWVTNRYLRAL